MQQMAIIGRSGRPYPNVPEKVVLPEKERKEDEGKLVEFFSMLMVDKKKSAIAGYDIFKKIDAVRFVVDEYYIATLPLLKIEDARGRIVDSPLRREFMMRFPRHWRMYQDQEELGGTPLRSVPGADPALVATLTFSHGIEYCEHLIAMKDEDISHIDGAIYLKEQAKSFIADDSLAERERKVKEAALAKNEALQAELEAAQAQLQHLKELIEAQEGVVVEDNSRNSSKRRSAA